MGISNFSFKAFETSFTDYPRSLSDTTTWPPHPQTQRSRYSIGRGVRRHQPAPLSQAVISRSTFCLFFFAVSFFLVIPMFLVWPIHLSLNSGGAVLSFTHRYKVQLSTSHWHPPDYPGGLWRVSLSRARGRCIRRQVSEPGLCLHAALRPRPPHAHRIFRVSRLHRLLLLHSVSCCFPQGRDMLCRPVASEHQAAPCSLGEW